MDHWYRGCGWWAINRYCRRCRWWTVHMWKRRRCLLVQYHVHCSVQLDKHVRTSIVRIFTTCYVFNIMT